MAPFDAGGKPLGGLARAFAALRGRLYTPPPNTISGMNPAGWPTALQPVQPNGPPGSQPLSFSYYFGINQQITPRFDEPLTSAALRQLATYPLARICIENVKDVICTLSWSIQLKQKKGEPVDQWKKRKDADSQAGALMDFFEYPDGETPWGDWLRPILEDMLVIDAASILCQRTLSGKLVHLRWTDGADILRLIDDEGFTPQMPSPAYTQLWEGIPRLLLTAEQLVYRPSNIVAANNYSSKLYGNSITQQMAEEIKIGQARLNYVLAFYTEGGVPGLAQIIPPGVAPDKIVEAQQWLTSDLSGQLAKRRGWRLLQGFVDPSQGGKDQIVELKDPILADAFDDLHIRKMCFGYGNSAQRLLKQMNRASAEAGQDASEKEGIQPRLKWLKGTIDLIIQRRMQRPDHEMIWDTDDELDVVKQEAVDSNYVKTGQRTIDENRVARGLVPFGLPETKSPIIITTTGVQPLEGSFDRVQQALDNDTATANKPLALPAPGQTSGGGGAPKKR